MASVDLCQSSRVTEQNLNFLHMAKRPEPGVLVLTFKGHFCWMAQGRIRPYGVPDWTWTSVRCFCNGAVQITWRNGTPLTRGPRVFEVTAENSTVVRVTCKADRMTFAVVARGAATEFSSVIVSTVATCCGAFSPQMCDKAC